MKHFELFIPGKPFGKQDSRRITRGKKTWGYQPKETQEYAARVVSLFKAKYPGAEPICGPVGTSITSVFPIPKSFTKKQRELIAAGNVYPVVKPDTTNIRKGVEDALNGLAWLDDKQVVIANDIKVYQLGLYLVGVTIRIEEL